MIKKTLLTVAVVGLVAGLLFGRDALSYLKTGANRVSDGVKDSVPTSFQIDRARQMVSELTPNIRDAMHMIAKEEVALEHLDEQIVAAEQSSNKLQGEILQMQADLTSGKSTFHYASRSYERGDVERSLKSKFARYKVSDETLDSMKQMRDARAANLMAAREKYAAMVTAQKKLETDVKCLEAKQALVEVAQASSEVVLDDSKLARTKELINDIRASLDVKARIANADVDVVTEISLDPEDSADITDQVAAYFNLVEKDSNVAQVSYED
ncbi:hypothetical protein NG895_13735 [Aeoliella sp. ICT_H6.2]|uniref:Uncharacterized protein n=1 Tax=Aeoliella straminimaris TaxID=2954799 RepID=A0A9X2JGP9_9BACT|nr:hypothetical protein [Aeoliella straminimaris]MCO6044966.1 hypothetical protein [Aeoliella straminimaris]